MNTARPSFSGRSTLAQPGSGTTDESDQEVRRHRIFARAYTVFHSRQVDGYTPPALPILADDERIEAGGPVLCQSRH